MSILIRYQTGGRVGESLQHLDNVTGRPYQPQSFDDLPPRVNPYLDMLRKGTYRGQRFIGSLPFNGRERLPLPDLRRSIRTEVPAEPVLNTIGLGGRRNWRTAARGY